MTPSSPASYCTSSDQRRWRAARRPHSCLRQEIAATRATTLQTRQSILDEFNELSRQAWSDHLFNHRYFVLLYFFTTDSWIEYAKRSEFPGFVYRLVQIFHGIYDASIVGYLRTGRCEPRYAHWLPYFRALETYTDTGNLRDFATAVFRGARAHTRFDLREAIAATFRQERESGHTVPAPSELRAELFGRHSDRIFQRVSDRFCACLAGEGGAAARLLATPGVTTGLASAKPIWIRLFQHWRHQAFDEAIGDLEVAAHAATGVAPPARSR